MVPSLDFFTPELFHGIGSAGFHIHFADDNRSYGGHVLDFEVDDVVIEIQNFETFQQHFPVNNETFVKTKLITKMWQKKLEKLNNPINIIRRP